MQSMQKAATRTRAGISSTALIVAVSTFVALFSNVAFLSAARQIYGSDLLYIAALFLVIVSIFVLVLSAVCHRALIKPVLIAFLLVSSVIAYFANRYGT